MLKKLFLILFILLIAVNTFALVRVPSGILRSEISSKCEELLLDACENPSLSDFDDDGTGDCEIQDDKCKISEEKEKNLTEKTREEIKSQLEQIRTMEFTFILLLFGLPIIGLALLRWKIKSEKWKKILFWIIIVLIILSILAYSALSSISY